LSQRVYSRFRIYDKDPAEGKILYKTLKQTTAVPRTTAPLRVALISDFHGWFMRIPLKKLFTAIRDAEADLLLFGGDLVSWTIDRPYAFRRMKRLLDLLSPLRLPVFAVRGNHDAGVPRHLFEDIGLPLLENESVYFKDRRQNTWLLVGLEDLRIGRPDFAAALRHCRNGTPEMCAAEAMDIPPERRIALAHNPDTIYLLSRSDCAVLLSGHFHGGQIRLPFHLEFKTLRAKDSLCQEGIYRWHHERNGIAGYITNGIGCVLFPLRFLCPPELSILDFYTESAD
jgi:predicted MPP superfamily phosphohydrolase